MESKALYIAHLLVQILLLFLWWVLIIVFVGLLVETTNPNARANQWFSLAWVVGLSLPGVGVLLSEWWVHKSPQRTEWRWYHRTAQIVGFLSIALQLIGAVILLIAGIYLTTEEGRWGDDLEVLWYIPLAGLCFIFYYGFHRFRRLVFRGQVREQRVEMDLLDQDFFGKSQISSPDQD